MSRILFLKHVLVARPLRADWQVLAAQCDHHPDDDYFPRVGVLSQFMSAVERQRLFHNTVRLIGGASNHVRARHRPLRGDPSRVRRGHGAFALSNSLVASAR